MAAVGASLSLIRLKSRDVLRAFIILSSLANFTNEGKEEKRTGPFADPADDPAGQGLFPEPSPDNCKSRKARHEREDLGDSSDFRPALTSGLAFLDFRNANQYCKTVSRKIAYALMRQE